MTGLTKQQQDPSQTQNSIIQAHMTAAMPDKLLLQRANQRHLQQCVTVPHTQIFNHHLPCLPASDGTEF